LHQLIEPDQSKTSLIKHTMPGNFLLQCVIVLQAAAHEAAGRLNRHKMAGKENDT
jgi:hypothetical protein